MLNTDNIVLSSSNNNECSIIMDQSKDNYRRNLSGERIDSKALKPIIKGLQYDHKLQISEEHMIEDPHGGSKSLNTEESVTIQSPKNEMTSPDKNSLVAIED